jgi:hypothetical protein
MFKRLLDEAIRGELDQSIDEMDEDTHSDDIFEDEDEDEGPTLHILSEPVAAMLHCMKSVVVGPQLSDMGAIMVVDVGGGTLDLTIFEWDGNCAKQLMADDGSFDAGNKVDEYFIETLVACVGGSEVWETFLEYSRNPPSDENYTSDDLSYIDSRLQSLDRHDLRRLINSLSD